jgi:hypothetical protein
MELDPATPPQGIPLPLPDVTPIKVGIATTFPFTTNQKYCIDSCTVMAAEIKGYLLSPMPADQFLNDFFSTGDLPGLDEVPISNPGCYKTTVDAGKEMSTYDPFVSPSQESFTMYPSLALMFILRSWQPRPSLLASYLSTRLHPPTVTPQLGFPFKIKPDVSFYSAASDPFAITDSPFTEIFVEFKWNQVDNPFCNVRNIECLNCTIGTVKSFLRETKTADDTLGQITLYAAAQLGSQFRTHSILFS